MKSSLAHLPKNKQDELQNIATIIRDNCSDVEKIILYGSYARGTYKEIKDLHPQRKSGHVSDYDILVVTAKKEVALDAALWSKISNICKNLNLSASPRIITHDIVALNIKLAEGQYFFSDVKKDGIAIFDLGKFELEEERILTSKERQRIAQDHFDEWFKSSESFFRMHKFCMSENDNKRAAFCLHQAAESAYKTVLLVFSNYNPNEHFLTLLGSQAERYHALLENIFSKQNQLEEDRFMLLEYAYIGGRYDPNYKVSKEDLEILAKDVKKLLDLTKRICEEKIEGFC